MSLSAANGGHTGLSASVEGRVQLGRASVAVALSPRERGS